MKARLSSAALLGVAVNIAHLADFLCQVALERKAQCASPGALCENGRFNIGRIWFSGRLFLTIRVNP